MRLRKVIVDLSALSIVATGLLLTTFARGQQIVWSETFQVYTNTGYDELITIDYASDGHGGFVYGCRSFSDPDIRFYWYGPSGEEKGVLWLQALGVFTRVAIIQASPRRVRIQEMQSWNDPFPWNPMVPRSNNIWSMSKTKNAETKYGIRRLRDLKRERPVVADRLQDKVGYFQLTPIYVNDRQVGLTITRYAGAPPP